MQTIGGKKLTLYTLFNYTKLLNEDVQRMDDYIRKLESDIGHNKIKLSLLEKKTVEQDNRILELEQQLIKLVNNNTKQKLFKLPKWIYNRKKNN
jgi:hypothetical protein